MANTIYLYGALGKKYGKKHNIHVSTPAEAIRALAANFDGFLSDILKSGEKGTGYRIVCGKGDISEKQLHDPTPDSIKIIPVLRGAKRGGVAQVLLAIVIIVIAINFPQYLPAALQTAGGTAAASVYMFAASLAIGGITQMLSAQSKATKPSESVANDPSYVFSGAVNTMAQGHPVPLGYGRLIVGSAVISAGISIEQIPIGVVTTGGTATGIPVPTWTNPVTRNVEEVPPPTVIWNVNKFEYELPDGTPLTRGSILGTNGEIPWYSGSKQMYLNVYLHRMELPSPTVLAQWDGSVAPGMWRMYVNGDWKGDVITLNLAENRYENTSALALELTHE